MTIFKATLLVLFISTLLTACAPAEKFQVNEEQKQSLAGQGLSKDEIRQEMSDFRDENDTNLNPIEAGAVGAGYALQAGLLIISLALFGMPV